MSNEQLTKEVIALPFSDRVALAQALWQSIDGLSSSDAAIEEREAIETAAQRDKELSSNIIQGRSHQQVIASVQRALGCN